MRRTTTINTIKARKIHPMRALTQTNGKGLVVMAAIIFGVDFAFFRNRFWERLGMNIGLVLVFAAFYWRFLKP
jgi:hypothetical protein